MRDRIEVLSHGDMHEEMLETDLQTKYPICQCPECGGFNTLVKKDLKLECGDYWSTGRKIGNDGIGSIFNRESEIVCYECDTCKCKWVKYYPVKRHRWDMDEDFCYFVIFGLLCLLVTYICVMAFIGLCNVPTNSNLCAAQGIFNANVKPDLPDFFVGGLLIALFSLFGAIGLGVASCVCLSNFEG